MRSRYGFDSSRLLDDAVWSCIVLPRQATDTRQRNQIKWAVTEQSRYGDVRPRPAVAMLTHCVLPG
jgi:hypothetical protein